MGSHLLSPAHGRTRPARVCARSVTEGLDWIQIQSHAGLGSTCLSAEHIVDFAACLIEGLRV